MWCPCAAACLCRYYLVQYLRPFIWGTIITPTCTRTCGEYCPRVTEGKTEPQWGGQTQIPWVTAEGNVLTASLLNNLSRSDSVIGEKRSACQCPTLKEALWSDRDLFWFVESLLPSPVRLLLPFSPSEGASTLRWRGSSRPWPGGGPRGHKCGPLSCTAFSHRSCLLPEKAPQPAVSHASPEPAARKHTVIGQRKTCFKLRFCS